MRAASKKMEIFDPPFRSHMDGINGKEKKKKRQIEEKESRDEVRLTRESLFRRNGSSPLFEDGEKVDETPMNVRLSNVECRIRLSQFFFSKGRRGKQKACKPRESPAGGEERQGVAKGPFRVGLLNFTDTAAPCPQSALPP